MQAERKEPGVDFRRIWRARPSRREGFNKTYSGQFPDGSAIEIDYNFAREMVRIEYSPIDEAERVYIAVIKHGVVLRERDFATNRSVDMQRRIRPLARYFQYFPDNHVLRSLGGVYGLPTQSLLPVASSARDLFRRPFRPGGEQQAFRTSVHGYFRRKRAAERKRRPWLKRLRRRLPADLFDVGLSAVPLWMFVERGTTPEGFALMLGTLGFATGAIDALWRQRNPLVSKLLFYLVPAVGTVWLKYQLEEWAIFEPLPAFVLRTIGSMLAGSLAIAGL